MSKIPKLAPSNLKNRSSSPLISWMRDLLLAVKRDPNKTPPPGIPGPDGEAVYMTPNRFPNTQSSRSVEPAQAQGGIHHKLADNYYYERDGRRAVLPPSPIYKAEPGKEADWKKAIEGPIKAEQMEKHIGIGDGDGINRGPAENFGLTFAMPTPGFGYEWKRSIENEEYSQQINPEFEKLEKFDYYQQKQNASIDG